MLKEQKTTFVLLAQNVPGEVCDGEALAAVGDSDGELLVTVSTVSPHTADHVHHLLLLRSGPGQRTLHRLRVGGDAGEVVLGRDGDHVVVGGPDEVHDVTSRVKIKYWVYCSQTS